MNNIFVLTDDEGFFIAAFDSLENAQEYKSALFNSDFGGDIEEVQLNPLYESPKLEKHDSEYTFKDLKVSYPDISDFAKMKFPQYTLSGLFNKLYLNRPNEATTFRV